MAEIEQVKLSEFFRSVKRPRYILGTTYTLSLAFFESVVYSCIDRHELKYCLIIAVTDTVATSGLSVCEPLLWLHALREHNAGW